MSCNNNINNSDDTRLFAISASTIKLHNKYSSIWLRVLYTLKLYMLTLKETICIKIKASSHMAQDMTQKVFAERLKI